MLLTVEHVILVGAHGWQSRHIVWVHEDVARRAGAAPAAQGEQLVESVVANYFHDLGAELARDDVLASIAGHDNQFRHCCSNFCATRLDIRERPLRIKNMNRDKWLEQLLEGVVVSHDVLFEAAV